MTFPALGTFRSRSRLSCKTTGRRITTTSTTSKTLPTTTSRTSLDPSTPYPTQSSRICTFKVFTEEALVFLKKHNATKLGNIYVQALVIIRDKRKKNSPANVLPLANIRRKLWGTLRAKMRPPLGRYIRTLEAASFFMSHSAKALYAMCKKKHVGCIHHPLEKRKSRWPNTASGASRRPTFLTSSSLWTCESTPKRYSSRRSIKSVKAQLEAKKPKEALQLQQTKWSCVCERVCECVYMWTCQIVFIFTVSE